MLPFLKPKKQTGVIIETRKNDGSSQEKGMEGTDHEMEAVAQDMIRALGMKDAKALAEALRAAFDIFDSQPHDEYDHEQDDSIVE